ncbi:hypothetical protein B0J14DRAFT_487680 [Halenospora varia]|nr:hypothetical protein B0J14DRAFT_487680 [Halenospora varia]
MIHIAEHFYEGRQLNSSRAEHPRPDYFVLDHMKRSGLLCDEDYEFAIQYTERPRLSTICEPGFQPPETRAREERQMRSLNSYDLAGEERLRRREARVHSRRRRP